MEIPQIINAGDSFSFTENNSSYPASAGWTLKYILINNTSKIELDSVASGDNHVFTKTKTATAEYAAGTYQARLYAENDTQRINIANGTVEVKPNIYTAATCDTRSHARKTLEAIEAAIERRASKEQASISIKGRAIQYMNPDELLKLKAHYKNLVWEEERAEKIARGESPGGRILTRFR